MRKTSLIIFPFLLFSLASAKAQLIIDSVSFQVQTGAVVTVTNDITSAKGLPGYGKFLLQGTDSQSVNMNGNVIPNLEIDNASGVWLKEDMKVSNSLLFTNGKLVTDDHNFSLGDIADVSGMGNGKFIETNKNGKVFKEISTLNLTSNEIPVGAGTLYRPVFVTTTGSNDGGEIGIKVFDSASANKPPSTTDYLKTNWTITKTGINGALSVDARYVDPTDVSGTESNLATYLFDGSDWTPSGTINTTNNTISFPISIASANITAIDKFDLLKAKVFLQGAYDATSHLMSDNLRTAGVLPFSNPYAQSPYNTAFTEVSDALSETADASVFTDQPSQSDNIVDWVFLELRNTTAGSNVVQTRGALVQRDGDIVDIDGKSPVTFNNVDPGNYTIAVRHRNHLGLSTDPATYTPLLSSKQSTAPLVDFTTSAFLFGGSSAHGVASDGKYVLWGGNADMNNEVNFIGIKNDKGYIYITTLNSIAGKILTDIYSPSDLNMDSKVNFVGIINDKSFLYNNILESSTGEIKNQLLP
jgi:hypothetical protein